MDKKKILLIDDEVSFTNIVRLNLEETGKYEVRVENKGSRGLAAAKEFKPDLIFVDIIMPDTDGSEVARQIREDPAVSNTRVIFLTAIVSEEEAESRSGLIGGNVFIAKPVSLEKLLAYAEKYSA
jgi:DNA-binding response OmpR family regulator